MHSDRRKLCVIVLAALALLLIQGAQGASRERIKVLLTGRVSEGFLINSYFLEEPSVEPTIVPSRDVGGSIEALRRIVRVYFPRTDEGVQEQDFFTFGGTNMEAFVPRHQEQIRKAMELGSGGLNSRSIISAEIFPLWVGSRVQVAFPNDAEAVASSPSHHRAHQAVQIILNEDPGLERVLTMFKGKAVQWYLPDYSCGLVLPKPGATIWSWIRGPFGGYSIGLEDATPHLISWVYGKGLTWTCHDRLANWWQDPIANPFGLDMILNMIFLSAGWELPQDVDQLINVRQGLMEYRTRMQFLMATIEFAELFGANMLPIETEMGVIDDMKREAISLYVEQDYLQSLERVNAAIDELEALNEEAMQRKDRAMVWVFLVEWLVVTSTAMLCGFLLWSLMVRRRLYKEVASTKPYMRRRV